MKSNYEIYRTLLSRIAAFICLFFFFTTQSCWESKNEYISFSLFLAGIILVAIASLGRMWCSLYIAGYKDDILVTKGPYSLCRNPLYFFSMIGVAGIGFATETLTFPIAFTILFALYYPSVIKSEEKRLMQLFGIEFERYKSRVPAFFPKFSTFDEPEIYSVKPEVYREHMFSALWFVWLVGILEVIEGMKEIRLLKAIWTIY